MSIGPFLLGIALAAESPPDVEVQYGVCVHCHGAHGEGRPELGAPRIGDLDPAYVAAQLEAFRDGTRATPEAAPMVGVAQGLSDDQIATLSEHVASLTPEVRSPGEPAPDGKTAYAPCEACHGADARGNPELGAPDLLFQDPDYLGLQLRAYREGQRPGVMPALVAELDDAAIAAITAHIVAIRPERPSIEDPEPTLGRDEGLAAFADIYAVATHPRCMNCHPDGDVPYQTDASTPHTMGITRFSPLKGSHCSTCHAPSGVGPGQAPIPPADTLWSMPPKDMVFENRTPAELCVQLKDPETNGGRGLVGLTEHVAHDHLLLTSWHSGRTPPPISHPELVERFETWTAAGGPCPEDP